MGNDFDNSPEPFRKQLNTWVQTIGILMAGTWAAYTFGYEKWWVPNHMPAYANVEVKLTALGKTEVPKGGEKYAVVRFDITLSNDGERSVSILPSIAWLIGHTLDASMEVHDRSLYDEVATLHKVDGRFLRWHLPKAAERPLGLFNPFTDWILEPGEKTGRTRIFHVPSGRYDTIEAKAVVIVARDAENVTARWEISEKGRFKGRIHETSGIGDQLQVKPWVNDVELRKDRGIAIISAEAVLDLNVETSP